MTDSKIPEVFKAVYIEIFISLISIPILTNIIEWVRPKASTLEQYIFTAIILLIINSGFVLQYVYRTRGRLKKLVLTTLPILVAVIFIFLLRATLKQPTLYIILDASSNMESNFDQILPVIGKEINSSSDDIDIALAVFGGEISGNLGCEDVKQHLDPTSKDQEFSDISSKINLLNENSNPRWKGRIANCCTLFNKTA